MAIAGKFDFDVFISYSHVDKAWVRCELLTRIEQAGLKAFIDYRDFTRGVPSIKEMERGVVKCRKTLLLLTPDYVQSDWCEIGNGRFGVAGLVFRNAAARPKYTSRASTFNAAEKTPMATFASSSFTCRQSPKTALVSIDGPDEVWLNNGQGTFVNSGTGSPARSLPATWTATEISICFRPIFEIFPIAYG